MSLSRPSWVCSVWTEYVALKKLVLSEHQELLHTLWVLGETGWSQLPRPIYPCRWLGSLAPSHYPPDRQEVTYRGSWRPILKSWSKWQRDFYSMCHWLLWHAWSSSGFLEKSNQGSSHRYQRITLWGLISRSSCSYLLWWQVADDRLEDHKFCLRKFHTSRL